MAQDELKPGDSTNRETASRELSSWLQQRLTRRIQPSARPIPTRRSFTKLPHGPISRAASKLTLSNSLDLISRNALSISGVWRKMDLYLAGNRLPSRTSKTRIQPEALNPEIAQRKADLLRKLGTGTSLQDQSQQSTADSVESHPTGIKTGIPALRARATGHAVTEIARTTNSEWAARQPGETKTAKPLLERQNQAAPVVPGAERSISTSDAVQPELKMEQKDNLHLQANSRETADTGMQKTADSNPENVNRSLNPVPHNESIQTLKEASCPKDIENRLQNLPDETAQSSQESSALKPFSAIQRTVQEFNTISRNADEEGNLKAVSGSEISSSYAHHKLSESGTGVFAGNLKLETGQTTKVDRIVKPAAEISRAHQKPEAIYRSTSMTPQAGTAFETGASGNEFNKPLQGNEIDESFKNPRTGLLSASGENIGVNRLEKPAQDFPRSGQEHDIISRSAVKLPAAADTSEIEISATESKKTVAADTAPGPVRTLQTSSTLEGGQHARINPAEKPRSSFSKSGQAHDIISRSTEENPVAAVDSETGIAIKQSEKALPVARKPESDNSPKPASAPEAGQSIRLYRKIRPVSPISKAVLKSDIQPRSTEVLPKIERILRTEPFLNESNQPGIKGTIPVVAANSRQPFSERVGPITRTASPDQINRASATWVVPATTVVPPDKEEGVVDVSGGQAENSNFAGPRGPERSQNKIENAKEPRKASKEGKDPMMTSFQQEFPARRDMKSAGGVTHNSQNINRKPGDVFTAEPVMHRLERPAGPEEVIPERLEAQPKGRSPEAGKAATAQANRESQFVFKRDSSSFNNLTLRRNIKPAVFLPLSGAANNDSPSSTISSLFTGTRSSMDLPVVNSARPKVKAGDSTRGEGFTNVSNIRPPAVISGNNNNVSAQRSFSLSQTLNDGSNPVPVVEPEKRVSPPDLKKLAREIYPLIKLMIIVDKELMPG